MPSSYLHRCKPGIAASLLVLLATFASTALAITPVPFQRPAFDAEFPVYRSAVILNVSREQALAALSDIPGLSRWLFLSDHAAAVPDEKDPAANWIHLFLKPMLGVGAQDAVLRVSRAQSSDLRTITISLHSEADRLPAIPEYRRIEQLNVQFTLTSLAPRQTALEMAVQVQPAMPIPAIAQPFLGFGPHRSLAYLQEVLSSGRYSNPSVILNTPRVKEFFKGITP